VRAAVSTTWSDSVMSLAVDKSGAVAAGYATRLAPQHCWKGGMYTSGNVTLMVADMDRAVEFYAEKLGLELAAGAA
jgi:catechol-2,3-dioxygenase